MLRNVDIRLLVVIGLGVVDDVRTTTSPHVKHIHGERISSRAYLYGATLEKRKYLIIENLIFEIYP
jgi:hypothetical protein